MPGNLAVSVLRKEYVYFVSFNASESSAAKESSFGNNNVSWPTTKRQLQTSLARVYPSSQTPSSYVNQIEAIVLLKYEAGNAMRSSP